MPKSRRNRRRVWVPHVFYVTGAPGTTVTTTAIFTNSGTGAARVRLRHARFTSNSATASSQMLLMAIQKATDSPSSPPAIQLTTGQDICPNNPSSVAGYGILNMPATANPTLQNIPIMWNWRECDLQPVQAMYVSWISDTVVASDTISIVIGFDVSYD